jgi:serine/threonine-protein kinase
MGVVYRALDPLIERTVAIKTFACAGLPAAEVEAFERRFFREAKLAGGLSHPNIVTVYDVGRSGDLAYIAMEFLEGWSLRQVLDSGVVLPAERIAEMAAQVADGLAFAHASGIVHRDIKPANIMVLSNETVKIADFGVALLPAGSGTLDGAVFGSPKYMSPEQVTGKVVDGRSDIFSLGAVLYEMLTGLAPFGGHELTAILYQVLNTDPPPPSSRRRQLPTAFDRIVARAMAKDPADRYQSAADFAADLRRHAQPLGPPGLAALVPAEAAASRAGEDTVPLIVQAPHLADEATGAPASTVRRRSMAFLIGVPIALIAVVLGWLWGRPGVQSVPPSAPVAAIGKPARTDARLSEAPAAPAPVEAVVAAVVPAAKPVLPPRPPKATARLQLAVAPWGEVYVDGHREGVSPPVREILLPAGKHRIEIRNGAFPRHRETLVLEPRATARIKHKFQ